MLGFLAGLGKAALGGLSQTSTRFWAILVLVFVLLGTFGYGYYRYTDLVESNASKELKIQSLETDLQTEKDKVVVAEDKYNKLKDDFEKVQAIKNGLDEKNKQYQLDIDRLNDKLNKAGRDIGYLANMKPETIQNLTNKASQQRNRCLEVISGKPKLKGEKNEVCPSLFVK